MSVRTSLILGLTLVLSLENARFAAADTKRSRSDKDIAAIGRRKLGNEKGNWYSLETEREIGRQESAVFDRQVAILGDPEVANYVASVADKIAHNSDAQMPIVIRVIDSEKVEAWRIPVHQPRTSTSVGKRR